MAKAEQLHKAFKIMDQIETIIGDLFEKYDPETYSVLDINIRSDWYDNSIEIYFNNSLPYPYEPCKEIREEIFKLGFSNVYWNFLQDQYENMNDEIRNYEPRHSKRSSTWISTKYGYVDKRFNESEWLKKGLPK